MALKTIYGDPVKNLSNARVVSSKESERLIQEKLKQDERAYLRAALYNWRVENDPNYLTNKLFQH